MMKQQEGTTMRLLLSVASYLLLTLSLISLLLVALLGTGTS